MKLKLGTYYNNSITYQCDAKIMHNYDCRKKKQTKNSPVLFISLKYDENDKFFNEP